MGIRTVQGNVWHGIITFIIITLLITIGMYFSHLRSENQIHDMSKREVNQRLSQYRLSLEDRDELIKVFLEDFKVHKKENGNEYVESLIYFRNIQTQKRSSLYSVNVDLRSDSNANVLVDDELNISLSLDKVIPYIFSKYVLILEEKNSDAALDEIKNVHFFRDTKDYCYKANLLDSEPGVFHEKIVIHDDNSVKFKADYVTEGDYKVFKVKDTEHILKSKPLWYVDLKSVESIIIYRNDVFHKLIEEKNMINEVFKMLRAYDFENSKESMFETRARKYKYTLEFEDQKHKYKIFIDDEKIILENEHRISKNEVAEEFEFFLDVFQR